MFALASLAQQGLAYLWSCPVFMHTQYVFTTPCPSSSNACCVLLHTAPFLVLPRSATCPGRSLDVARAWRERFPIRFCGPCSLRGSSSLGLVPSMPWRGISHSAEILYGSAVSHYSPVARLDPLNAECAPGGRWCGSASPSATIRYYYSGVHGIAGFV